jgi:hypothetical protein
MAFNTLPLRDMGIPLNDIEMAFLTGDPSFNILSVIETPAFDFDVPFGLDVARGATAYGTRDAFLFSSWSSLVVMTDETVGVMNGEVRALDDLGMAGGASKFHSPSQVAQMFFMREDHILVNHIPLEIFDLVAPLLEATRIIDLCVRHAWLLSGDEISQRYLSIYPFPL